MARKEVSLIVSSNYDSRIFRRTLTLGQLRVLAALATALALIVVAALILAGTGVFRIARLSFLENRNRLLEAEFAKVTELSQRLERLEQERARMAAMLGVELTPPPVDWRSAAIDSAPVPPLSAGEAGGGRAIAFLLPVDGFALSRGFSEQHRGVDLAAQSGSAVRATAAGTATRVGENGVFGRFVLLTHAGGYESYYGHLLEQSVGRGDSVGAGQPIGEVGSTGISSAPHLHFEIRREGVAVDPARLLPF